MNANEADSLFLYLDDPLIRKIAASAFDTSLIPNGSKRHELIVTAVKGGSSLSDTAWFLVPGITQVESLPDGYMMESIIHRMIRQFLCCLLPEKTISI